MTSESECNIHKHQRKTTILYTNIHSLGYKTPHIEWEIKQIPNVLVFCVTEITKVYNGITQNQHPLVSIAHILMDLPQCICVFVKPD